MEEQEKRVENCPSTSTGVLEVVLNPVVPNEQVFPLLHVGAFVILVAVLVVLVVLAILVVVEEREGHLWK